MPSPPSIYAIDFGTSNSLLAAASADDVFDTVPLDKTAADPTVLRSILYFPAGKACYYGHEALTKYVENGLEGRFLRSIKRHLPSREFRGTIIHSQKVAIEDLVASILREMRNRANAHFGTDVKSVVLGRPARFSTNDADDDFAEQRLRAAAERAGFEDIRFLPEPVAAAREFGVTMGEEQRDKRERTVLVCDFGGGTSDFTLMRLGASPFKREDVLAIGGVPVAGDALDAGIMRKHVSKNFGADVSYKVPMGNNVLRMPLSIVEQLCSPAHLSALRRPDVADFLRDVRNWSVGDEDAERLDALQTLVDDALGFQLFESIESAKRRLSDEKRTDVAFDYPTIHVREPVTRDDFEACSRGAMDSILQCLDATVAASGIAPSDVDLVCSTGGTARVPKLAQEIRRRFPKAEVRSFKGFHSVVLGLAQQARSVARGDAG
ncbi:MAG: Hsp70 family protein [Polyangiaceae bacterium]